jgi:hypothetical protein
VVLVDLQTYGPKQHIIFTTIVRPPYLLEHRDEHGQTKYVRAIAGVVGAEDECGDLDACRACPAIGRIRSIENSMSASKQHGISKAGL